MGVSREAVRSPQTITRLTPQRPSLDTDRVGSKPNETGNPDSRGKSRKRNAKPKARGGLLTATHVVVRAIAIVLGAACSVVALMSLVRPLTESLPVQLAVAVALSLLVPAVIVARLFPDRPKREASSLSWDVLAIVWISFGAAFFGLAHHYTQPWLAKEARLLAASGLPDVALAIELAAAVRPMPVVAESVTEPTSAPTPSASTPESEPDDAPVSPPPSAAVSSTPEASPQPLKRPENPLPLAVLDRRLAPAIVTVVTDGPRGRRAASGVFVNRGVVATTRDVMREATAVGLERHDHRWVQGGKLLAVSEGLDFALLRVELNDTPRLHFAPPRNLEPGTVLVTFARPLGRGQSHWLARVAGPMQSSILPLDAEVPPHREGALVVDRFGEAVGIVVHPDRAPEHATEPATAVLSFDPVMRRLEASISGAKTLEPLPDGEVL